MVTNRRESLQAFVDANPNDAFARYGLAMELMRAGEADTALAEFARLRERHPDYAAAYQQAGQLLIALDRRDEARTVLTAGIAAAERKADRHAAAEMEGLMAETG